MTNENREGTVLLVDILSVLHRWRWAILAAIVGGATVFAGAGFLMPAKHEYRVVVEVGRLFEKPFEGQSEAEALVHVFQMTARGAHKNVGFKYIESPEDGAGTLQAIAFDAYRDEFGGNETDPGFSIGEEFSSRPIHNWKRDETALLEAKLSVYGPADNAADFLEVVASRLVSEHQEKVDRHLESLGDATARFEKTLARYVDTIQATENAVSLLEPEKTRIEKDIERYRQLLRQLESPGSLVFEGQSDPFRKLLFLEKIREFESGIDRLRERLAVELPERERTLRREFAELETRAAAVEGKLESIDVARDSTHNSRIVSPPSDDGNVLPRPLALYAILGAVFAAILALFAIFLAEFWRANS